MKKILLISIAIIAILLVILGIKPAEKESTISRDAVSITASPSTEPTLSLSPTETSQISPINKNTNNTTVPNSGVQINTETKYYQLYGSSEQEIRREMDQSGPLDKSGRRGDAYTNWYVKWNYDHVNSGGSCRIAQPKVSMDVTFTMPKWNQPSGVSNELIKKWENYARVLQLHEDGHKEFGVKASNEILSELPKIPPQSTCAALDTQVRQVTDRIMTKYLEQEVQYDKTTNHGETQGARFP